MKLKDKNELIFLTDEIDRLNKRITEVNNLIGDYEDICEMRWVEGLYSIPDYQIQKKLLSLYTMKLEVAEKRRKELSGIEYSESR